MCDIHQIIEEPCEKKFSSTVLKTSGTGDSLAEFNELANMAAEGDSDAETAIKILKQARKKQEKYGGK